ncbi:hypothetical protein ABT112_04095 [Streptomyces sp. NPDC002055]|uniref:hypothetical protein n=1 Tax=Streptomyces sp. NPDC002055 TaxID=3154534 RepID=UPI00332D7B3A
MRSYSRSVVLVCAGVLALLSGCTADGATRSEKPVATPGPTATTTAASADAARLAQRYRRAGGLRQVYGIERRDGPGGAPLLIVRTRDADESAATFDELKGSITRFLAREQGLPLRKGYLMDVLGPDGSLQHRFDARP